VKGYRYNFQKRSVLFSVLGVILCRFVTDKRFDMAQETEI